MSNYLNKIVVIDLEATCWKNDWERPKKQVSDIIEFGVSVLDIATLNIESTRSIIVKPVRSKVSHFCTELTTLTQEDVDKGTSFVEALSIMRDEFKTKFRPWASYGNYDREQIRRQCIDYRVENPMGPTHINVKNLAAISLGLTKEANMMEMLKALNINHTGTHHRGVDDSYNIALILKRILERSRYV